MSLRFSAVGWAGPSTLAQCATQILAITGARPNSAERISPRRADVATVQGAA